MRNPTVLFTFACAAMVCFHSRPALAQAYTIDWFKVAGGGTSTNNSYALSGTAGQPDAGVMTGGGFTLAGGFWGGVVAVQTFGAPLLSLHATRTNSVVISWPSPSAGFVLQQCSNLGTPNWVNVPQSPADDGTNRTVTISPAAGNQFFRLKR